MRIQEGGRFVSTRTELPGEGESDAANREVVVPGVDEFVLLEVSTVGDLRQLERDEAPKL
jgi:hypothetical protein